MSIMPVEVAVMLKEAEGRGRRRRRRSSHGCKLVAICHQSGIADM